MYKYDYRMKSYYIVADRVALFNWDNSTNHALL